MKYLLTLMLFWMTAHNIHACKCKGDQTLEEECKRTSVIIVARVIALDTVYQDGDTTIRLPWYVHHTPIIARYKIKVTYVLKGREFIADTGYIYTARDGAACGFRFVAGKDYFIFGRTFPSGIYTTHCTRTSPYYPEGLPEIKRILQEQEEQK